MSALQAVLPPRIRRRWDAAAINQIARTARAQTEEIAELRRALAAAEDAAEFWRQQAMELQQQLADATGGGLGITQAGQLVITSPEHRA